MTYPECQKLFEAMVEKSEEWILWDARSRIPIVTNPLPDGEIGFIYTEETRKAYDLAEEKRKASRDEYLKAIEKYINCVKDR